MSRHVPRRRCRRPSSHVARVLLLAAAMGAGSLSCGGESTPPPVAPPPAPSSTVSTPKADPEPFRAAPPAVGALPTYTPPSVVERRLANGMRIFVVPRHEVPLVAFDVVVDHGIEQTKEPGLATFVADMLDAGTTKRTANQLADAWQGTGASHRARAMGDGFGLSVSGLHDVLPTMLELASEMLRSPRFEEAEIESLRKRRKAAIAAERASNNDLARILASQLLFGPKHPLAGSALGTDEAIDKIRRTDLLAFMKAHVAPSRASIVFVGDVEPDEAETLAKKYFGAWTGRIPAPEAAAPAPDRPPSAPRIVLLDRPTANQSEVRVVDLGLTRKSPDYPAVSVMATILGGTFTSRINNNLRERNGYTYGASAYFDMRRDLGTFTASGAILKDKTAPALKELLFELRRMREEPVTDEELEAAKNRLTLSIASNFESTFGAASTLGNLVVLGLPLDELSTLPARWAKVSKEDVQRVARTYLNPDQMRIVIVGDAQSIQKDVEALGVSAVELRSLPATSAGSPPPTKASSKPGTTTKP